MLMLRRRKKLVAGCHISLCEWHLATAAAAAHEKQRPLQEASSPRCLSPSLAIVSHIARSLCMADTKISLRLLPETASYQEQAHSAMGQGRR